MSAPEENTELLFVEISGARFAFPTAGVAEVMPLVEPTAVPGWPSFGLGLIDVRGALFPLIDVSAVLSRPTPPISPSQFIVVIDVGGRRWGLLVDLVDGVRSALVRPFSGLVPGQALGAPEMSRGMAIEPQGPVVVLDPEALVRGFELPGGHAADAGQ
ncbi:MAG: chemotaxis protein CheW [Myxococcaceae bacterium]